ncbi:hypothetical protein CEXT_278711 [Caerostris extrusa]|uniref:Uncharacterized protein n=1 Tax=Caerostris extrusa TaxID=172846 RepID=A0AAV4MF13_CAEEX|nr:hypothetical protein CEXT_278711 [Caerostris extrusa]
MSSKYPITITFGKYFWEHWACKTGNSPDKRRVMNYLFWEMLSVALVYSFVCHIKVSKNSHDLQKHSNEIRVKCEKPCNPKLIQMDVIRLNGPRLEGRLHASRSQSSLHTNPRPFFLQFHKHHPRCAILSGMVLLSLMNMQTPIGRRGGE